MKKFLYIIVAALVIASSTFLMLSNNSKKIKYNSDTSTSTKMINTTVLIDHSNKIKAEEKKKQEEEEAIKEAEEKKKQEIARLEKIEEEKKKKAAATTKVVTETEVVGSRQQATLDENKEASSTEKKQEQIGETKTVEANSEKRVFEGAKFYDRKMSSYGTDCCATTAYKNNRVAQGLTEFPSEDEIMQKSLAGVGLGLTASGYQFTYKNIYFNAGQYGSVRMLAADHYGKYDFPLGTVVKITEIMDDRSTQEFKGIVLDRGDRNIGLDSKYIFDLVSENTLAARRYGIHAEITVEVLHVGTKDDLRNIRTQGHL